MHYIDLLGKSQGVMRAFGDITLELETLSVQATAQLMHLRSMSEEDYPTPESVV